MENQVETKNESTESWIEEIKKELEDYTLDKSQYYGIDFSSEDWGPEIPTVKWDRIQLPQRRPTYKRIEITKGNIFPF